MSLEHLQMKFYVPMIIMTVEYTQTSCRTCSNFDAVKMTAICGYIIKTYVRQNDHIGQKTFDRRHHICKHHISQTTTIATARHIIKNIQNRNLQNKTHSTLQERIIL